MSQAFVFTKQTTDYEGQISEKDQGIKNGSKVEFRNLIFLVASLNSTKEIKW